MVVFIRKTACIFLSAFLTVSLCGCFLFTKGSQTPEEYLVPIGMYRLVADFSNGTLEGDLQFKDVPIQSAFYDTKTQSKIYTMEAYSAAVLEIADYLSNWTGFDFTLNRVTDTENGLIVDWSKNSTLLTGLDDREQKEGFHFFDAVSLNWFMLDSLRTSIMNNLPCSFVYYCCEGQPLQFPNQQEMEGQDLPPIGTDEPYFGSYAYVSQVTDETVPLQLNGSSARITMGTQDYENGNIIEIPYFTNNGESNEILVAINRGYNLGLQELYLSFSETRGAEQWIEIRSYPFTSEKYLQVVSTSCIFPTDGTDGNIESVNYDVENNKWIGLDEAMERAGIDEESLQKNVERLFISKFENETVKIVETAGFVIQTDGGEMGDYFEFMLEITAVNGDGNYWKSFYSYTPFLDELIKMNSICLFDPYEWTR